MNWEDAYNSCFSLGKGWRLPTKLELNILYNNLNKIGDVGNDGYWTSTENGSERVWTQYLFNDGYSYDVVKYGSLFVRAVGNYGVVKIIPSKTKKSNTKVPSGIINGLSQQDLLNALFADDLKPSSEFSTPEYNAWQCVKCGILSRSKKEPCCGEFGKCPNGYINSGYSPHTFMRANTSSGHQCTRCGIQAFTPFDSNLLPKPKYGTYGKCGSNSGHNWRAF